MAQHPQHRKERNLMGAALGIGALLAVGGTALSASAQSAAGGAAQAAAGTAAKQLKGTAAKAVTTEKKGYTGAMALLAPWTDKLGNITSLASGAIGANATNLASIEDLGSKVDVFDQGELTKMLGKVLPGVGQMVQLASNNTLSMLQGQVPADVAAASNRGAAQQAQQGGFSGSASGSALSARDLGTTSLNLMNEGSNMAQQWISTARTQLMPTPFNPQSMFVTPQMNMQAQVNAAGVAEQQASDTMTSYDERAQTMMSGANAATNAILGGSLANSQAQQQAATTIGTGLSSIGGMVAGGTGAGAAGNRAATNAGLASLFGGSSSNAGGAAAGSGGMYSGVFGSTAGVGADASPSYL